MTYSPSMPLRHACSVGLLFLVTGCASGVYDVAEAQAVPEDFAIVPTPAKGALRGYPAYGSPIRIPTQPVEIIPYVRTEKDRWFRDGDPFDEGGLSRYSTGYGHEDLPAEISVRWHNAVVRVVDTGEQWPLLDFRGVISRAWIPTAQGDEGEAVPRALLFAVTFEDINRDGVIDDVDGARVLMTDPDGRNGRIVTPPGTHLDRISGGGPTGAVVLHLREDANENGRFSKTEIPVPYLLQLGGAEPAQRYVSSEVDKAIEALLEEQDD